MTIPNTPAFGSVAATVTGTITVPWGSGFTVTASGVGAASLPTGDPAAQYELDIAAVAGMATVSVTEGGSPHFSHARFGAVDYRTGYVDEPNKSIERAWLAAHNDLFMNGDLDTTKAANPNAKMFVYTLIATQYVLYENNDPVPDADGNNSYLTVDAWLTANDYPLENAWLHTAGTSATFANRVYIHITGFGWRYIPNPGDAGYIAFRTATTNAKMAANVSGNSWDGWMYDEISSGPLGVPSETLEYATIAAYRTDFNALLETEKALVPAGYNIVNTATYFGDDKPQVAAFIAASGAGEMEFANDGYAEVSFTCWEWVDARIAAGDKIWLGSQRDVTLRNTARFGMTAGNYTSVAERLDMAEYTNYLMMLNPSYMDGLYIDFYGDGPGADPSGTWPHSLLWHEAYETNIGLASGARSLAQEGSDPTGKHYHIYTREFANALVVTRPMMSYIFDDLGDSTVVTFNLPAGTWKMLLADGTLGGVVTSVNLRTSEGVIFMRS